MKFNEKASKTADAETNPTMKEEDIKSFIKNWPLTKTQRRFLESMVDCSQVNDKKRINDNLRAIEYLFG